MHEEEQLHGDEMTGSDALQQAGEVLGQSAQSAMDVEVLCMDHLRKSSDTRDSSSEAATLYHFLNWTCLLSPLIHVALWNAMLT
ncbi:hypothetical protein L3X38_030724 [Prunus dulcis]|uniref:Uncharacterized protein n=1 Tax=Prunus dulcis TaxID=3755 RepID=A0AAD4YUZ2_PRUDU|nr:hypothetical protein L3X38_030724 [Prunus dulcis]